MLPFSSFSKNYSIVFYIFFKFFFFFSLLGPAAEGFPVWRQEVSAIFSPSTQMLAFQIWTITSNQLTPLPRFVLIFFLKLCFKVLVRFSSVQSLSHVWLFATPWIAAHQATLSITNSRSSLRLTPIESVMPSSHLMFCHSLLLLAPIPPRIRSFSNESTLRMRWPKFWSFSFSIIPSKEHPGLISFRMDWLDLLAVQGTLKSLLQHYSSKASILRCSAFPQSNSHIHTWPLEKP